MRIAAGLALVVASLAHMLLAGSFLIATQVDELEAQSEAEDIAAVAGDLADEKTLARERSAAEKRMDRSAVTRDWVLGLMLGLLALAQLVAAVLQLLGRARATVLGIICVSLVGVGVSAILASFSWLAGIGGGLLLISGVLGLRAPPRALAA